MIIFSKEINKLVNNKVANELALITHIIKATVNHLWETDYGVRN